MTLKIELHAASTKRSDTYSPELCALSFMICLTGWESVFCKVSLSKYMWPSKVRAVTLYTQASKDLLWFEVIGTRLPAEVQSLIEESCSFIPTKHKQAVLWWQTFQQLRSCRSEPLAYVDAESRKKERRRPRFCKSPLAGSRMALGAHAQNLHICEGPESCTR